MTGNKTRVDFAAWLRDQLTTRGYDVTGLRSGGRTRFAADSGISPASVSRLLRAQPVTDLGILGTLAGFLGVPLAEILVRIGLITEGELYEVQHPDPDDSRRITPEEAANDLGITDPHKRALFLNMTRTLQQDAATPGEGEALAE
ncbi:MULTISPECIES: helix-turn-helix domain-containing protein [unclassified Streptomyces]|uniref:helix-turn-helix domain-containing protein n=1 Tax=unclassified Streptomyces TaxID=2593676 RepID=UPI0035D8C88F